MWRRMVMGLAATLTLVVGVWGQEPEPKPREEVVGTWRADLDGDGVADRVELILTKYNGATSQDMWTYLRVWVGTRPVVDIRPNISDLGSWVVLATATVQVVPVTPGWPPFILYQPRGEGRGLTYGRQESWVLVGWDGAQVRKLSETETLRCDMFFGAARKYSMTDREWAGDYTERVRQVEWVDLDGDGRLDLRVRGEEFLVPFPHLSEVEVAEMPRFYWDYLYHAPGPGLEGELLARFQEWRRRNANGVPWTHRAWVEEYVWRSGQGFVAVKKGP